MYVLMLRKFFPGHQPNPLEERSPRPSTFSSRFWVNLLPVVVMMGISIIGCQNPNRLLPLRLMGQVRTVEALQTQVDVGEKVYVQGTVGDRVPLVNGQVYELQDDTGTIWVVTNDVTITTGETLLIQGNLSYEATPEFGSDAGERYIWEVKQIERSP